MSVVRQRTGGDQQTVVVDLEAHDRMHALFAAGGEMGALMAEVDWAASPLGPVESWPQSLRSILSVLLTTQQPTFLWWGPEMVQFYNDAYRPILGRSMHPAALGERGRVTWAGIWDVIGPMVAAVLRGESTRVEDGLLVLDRNGYPEEGYFDYAYSPIRDETGGIGGIFAACGDMTTRVVGERRLQVLRDLSGDVGGSTTTQAACRRAVGTLTRAGYDVPFAAVFLTGPAGTTCAASTPGLTGPDLDPAAWAVDDATSLGGPVVRTGLDGSGRGLPGGPWPEPAHTAVVLPLATRTDQSDGAVVLGVSPRRALDEDYLSFLSVVASQIAAAIASARAREDERAKAEALAALDRSKTAFVENVSHEFRTPLTLILGPLESAIAEIGPDSPVREGLEAAHRNAERLLRLTNSLLDFSRMEGARLDATFEPVDLALLTADVAQSFRAVFEHSGVELVIDCPPMQETVHVDVDLWEKVVLNLLSNAFKFTFSGSVTVAVSLVGGSAQLLLTDTGEGVPGNELPRLFERFHRVWGMRSRTHEGTGIGLALVHELVTLHGGTIQVDSAPGKGTTFAVLLPLGTDHLDPDRCTAPRNGAPRLVADGYAKEAMLWGQGGPGASGAVVQEADQRDRPCILVVDDNADMRSYLVRVLADHYVVRTAADGALALASVQEHVPHLVLTDVMMPNVDGIELTRRLRADPSLVHVPVVMLSARAGPEAAVDGLGAGADDYLAKPFTTAELLARCRTHIELAELRATAVHDAERRYEQEHEVALLLQRSLLPEALPALHDVSLAAHYQACTLDAQIGGDWYDVVDLGDGCLVAVVGDVVGHDLRAASTMARFRSAIRAYAIEDPSPARVLERADHFVRRLETEFATVVVVTLDTRTGVLRYANAGHPPPLVARAGSAPRTLDVPPDPPLGLAVSPRTEATDRLQPGDVLLLYTDGLVERRDEEITDGIARLAVTFGAAVQAGDPATIPRRLAVSLVGDRADDDVAILTLSYR